MISIKGQAHKACKRCFSVKGVTMRGDETSALWSHSSAEEEVLLLLRLSSPKTHNNNNTVSYNHPGSTSMYSGHECSMMLPIMPYYIACNKKPDKIIVS